MDWFLTWLKFVIGGNNVGLGLLWVYIMVELMKSFQCLVNVLVQMSLGTYAVGHTTCRGLCEITLKYDGFGSDESARSVIQLAPSITDQPLVMCDVEFTARPRQRVLSCRSRVAVPWRGGDTTPPMHALRPTSPAINNRSTCIIASRQAVSRRWTKSIYMLFSSFPGGVIYWYYTIDVDDI